MHPSSSLQKSDIIHNLVSHVPYCINGNLFTVSEFLWSQGMPLRPSGKCHDGSVSSVCDYVYLCVQIKFILAGEWSGKKDDLHIHIHIITCTHTDRSIMAFHDSLSWIYLSRRSKNSACLLLTNHTYEKVLILLSQLMLLQYLCSLFASLLLQNSRHSNHSLLPLKEWRWEWNQGQLPKSLPNSSLV